MINMNSSDVEERVANGAGFYVGYDHLGRFDRYSDRELETTQEALLVLMGQAQDALDAISLVQQARYDQDTQNRAGQYAIE